MSLFELHRVLANTMILFSLAYGVWGVFNYARKKGPDGNYWGTLVLGEVLYLAQAIMGVLLVVQGLRPLRGVHFLYGVLAVISLPAAFAFTREVDERRLSLVFGLVGLFMAGVSIRGILTAGA